MRLLYATGYAVLCILAWNLAYQHGACHMMPDRGEPSRLMGCSVELVEVEPEPRLEPEPYIPPRYATGRTVVIAASTAGVGVSISMSSGGVSSQVYTLR